MKASKTLNGFELIVHIGTGKTGSSSIQKTLSANKAELEKAGVGYLGLMCEELTEKRYPWQIAGGWPLLVKLGLEKSQQQLEEVIAGALKELAARGIRRAIWSNESIFGNDALVIPVLKQLEALGVSIRPIVYIRRHDAWARSAYLQWGIKHKTYRGPVKSFKEWYGDRKISFFGGLKPWLEIFGRDISVRNFDAYGDVVVDFLNYFNIDTSVFNLRRDNETPNSVSLALWAMYNSQIDSPVLPVKLQRLLHQSGLLHQTLKGCDFTSLLPNQEDIDQVAKDTVADRVRLNEVFKEYGQPAMDVSAYKIKNIDVSQAEINVAFLLIIKHQDDQINNLKKKLMDLLGRNDNDKI